MVIFGFQNKQPNLAQLKPLIAFG